MTESTRSQWHWPVRIGAALLSVAIALLLLELILGRRTAPGDGAAFFDEAPDGLDVPYILKPNTEVAFEGHYVRIPKTTVRINAQGLRANREYAIPKPAGTRRALLLGDSFVFGSGVELEQTFGAHLEQALGAGWEVLNMGVPGYTSGHAAELLAKRGLAFEPDLVVLFISDNDFYTEGRQRREERRESGDQWAIERYTEGRLKGQEKADASWHKNADAVMDRITAALERINSLCAASQIEMRAFLLFPHPLQERILSNKFGVVRLTDAAYLRDIQSLQIPRDLHPNAEGHRRLGNLLHTQLSAQ